jgi:hypothetical protein
MTRHGYGRVKKNKKTGQPEVRLNESSDPSHRNERGRGENKMSLYKCVETRHCRRRQLGFFFFTCLCGSEVALNVDNRFPQLSRRLVSSYLSRPSIYVDCIYGQQGEKTRRTDPSFLGKRKSNNFVTLMLDEEVSLYVSSNWIFHHQLCWLPLSQQTQTPHSSEKLFFFFPGV